ncbi:hypothetical protein Tco_1420620 [Tanacetum coccineum]
MSTQQDIYAAGSENRPPMLNKENYVPWSSRLLRVMTYGSETDKCNGWSKVGISLRSGCSEYWSIRRANWCRILGMENVVAAGLRVNADWGIMEEAGGIQLQAERVCLYGCCSRDLDEIEEVNANLILMANLQQASTSGTQTDKAPVYDSDGSAEVHNYDNCYDNEIFNMFTQEEQYIELLEPIPEPHQVQQNDSNVIS